MNVNEICHIMDKAKQNGVSEFQQGTLKISFSHDKIVMGNVPSFGDVKFTNSSPFVGYPGTAQAIAQENIAAQKSFVPDKKIEELVKPISTLDQMSDKEILFAATPYFDELQEKKKMHQEKIDQELSKRKV